VVVSLIPNEVNLIPTVSTQSELLDLVLVPVHLYVAEVVSCFEFFFLPELSVHLHLSIDVLKPILCVTDFCKDESSIGVFIVLVPAETLFVPLDDGEIDMTFSFHDHSDNRVIALVMGALEACVAVGVSDAADLDSREVVAEVNETHPESAVFLLRIVELSFEFWSPVGALVGPVTCPFKVTPGVPQSDEFLIGLRNNGDLLDPI
jgi:hypothetical protein